MVPFRSSRSSRSQTLNENAPNRTRTGHIDHDVFEGLPVRRWSRQSTTYSQVPKVGDLDTSPSGSRKLPELPMPRDSHLLTASSRSLLRAARAGCTYIRPVRKDLPEAEGNDPKEDDPAEPSVYDRTFTAKKWGALPRQLDPPEVEFLAKRRAGLPSLYGTTNNASGDGLAQGTNQAPPMRKTKFKKVDPVTGNVSIYEAWVPEGHKVDGELTEDTENKVENPDVTAVTASPAPGTLIEGVGVVDQEGIVVAEPEASMVGVMRRRHPPPKRKAKGVGRGRGKKAVKFASGDRVARPAAPDNEAASELRPGFETPPVEGHVTGIASTDGQQEVANEGEEEEDEDEDGDGSDEDEMSGIESKPVAATADTAAVEANAEEPVSIPEAVKAEEQERPVVNEEETPKQPDGQQDIATAPQPDLSTSPDPPIATTAESTGPDTTISKSPTEESKPITAPTPPQPAVSQDDTVPSQPKEVSSGEVSPSIEPVHVAPDTVVATDVEPPIQPPADVSKAPQPEEANIIEQTHSLPPKPPSPLSHKPAKTPTPPSEPIAHEPSPPPPPPPPPPTEPVKAEQSQPDSPPKTTQAPVCFEDGEVDLLGSLEASLDKQPKPPVDQTAENEQNIQQADGLTASVKEESDVKDTEMSG